MNKSGYFTILQIILCNLVCHIRKLALMAHVIALIALILLRSFALDSFSCLEFHFP